MYPVCVFMNHVCACMNPVCAYVNVVCAFIFIETLLAPYINSYVKAEGNIKDSDNHIIMECHFYSHLHLLT